MKNVVFDTTLAVTLFTLSVMFTAYVFMTPVHHSDAMRLGLVIAQGAL